MAERRATVDGRSKAAGATRREALLAIGTAGVMLSRMTRSALPRDDDALDEALERIHSSEPFVPQGLSSHAPMVVEALCELGQADRAVEWIESHDATRVEIPQASRRIDRAHWKEALGLVADSSSWSASVARFGDWKELYVEELAAAPWRDVVYTWAARLAPGICAAATHGV